MTVTPAKQNFCEHHQDLNDFFFHSLIASKRLVRYMVGTELYLVMLWAGLLGDLLLWD